MTPAKPGQKEEIGTFQGVKIEALVADAVTAKVDLACACMFSHEYRNAALSGGLKHLDESLAGRLVRLREEGAFAVPRFQVTLMDKLPKTMAPKLLLFINLGDPKGWKVSMMEHAVGAAVNAACQLQVRAMAFAPSLLDSGFKPKQTADAPKAMLRGLLKSLSNQARLVEAGLTRRPALKAFYFGAGAAHLQSAVDSFKSSMDDLSAEHGRDDR